MCSLNSAAARATAGIGYRLRKFARRHWRALAVAGVIFAVCAVALMCGGTSARALDLGVFGDLSYIASDVPDDEANFRIGSLDFYAAQYIDDKTKALFELQFQTFSGTFEYEIQRYWIMREFSDSLRVGIGRFHTPLGYWSRHFHHGILLQDTVSRPFILSFEGSINAIMPMHMIGECISWPKSPALRRYVLSASPVSQ